MHDHLTYTSIGRQDLHLLSGGNAKHHLSAVFVVDPERIELFTAGLQGQLASLDHASPKFFVALSGIEPEFPT